jgi:hypothetical protein
VNPDTRLSVLYDVNSCIYQGERFLFQNSLVILKSSNNAQGERTRVGQSTQLITCRIAKSLSPWPLQPDGCLSHIFQIKSMLIAADKWSCNVGRKYTISQHDSRSPCKPWATCCAHFPNCLASSAIYSTTGRSDDCIPKRGTEAESCARQCALTLEQK